MQPVVRGVALALLVAAAVTAGIGLPVLLLGDTPRRTPVLSGGDDPDATVTTTAVTRPPPLFPRGDDPDGAVTTTIAPGPAPGVGVPVPDVPLEDVVAFSGDTWSLHYSETPRAQGVWLTCFDFRSTAGEDISVTSGCTPWSEDDPTTTFWVSAGPVLETEGGVVILVTMTPLPVANVAVVLDDGRGYEVVPRRAERSGAQFVAVEVPITQGGASIQAFAEDGTLLDRIEFDSLAVRGG
jgi:hypothetical protein